MFGFKRREPARIDLRDASNDPASDPNQVHAAVQQILDAGNDPQGAVEGVSLLTECARGRNLSAAAYCALAAGALIERGSPPGALGEVAFQGVRRALPSATPFLQAAQRLAGPEQDVPAAMSTVEAQDPSGAQAWIALDHFSRAAITALVEDPESRLRVAMDERELQEWRLVYPHLPVGDPLNRLLTMPVRERMLALRPNEPLGWWVEVDGIGDNFQLHTLLAAAVIGSGELPGDPPSTAQVEASGSVGGDGCLVERGWFNLEQWTRFANGTSSPATDLDHWIWNEGQPADIATYDGVKVIVLADPPFPRSWRAQRQFPQIPASVTVLQRLDAREHADLVAAFTTAATK